MGTHNNRYREVVDPNQLTADRTPNGGSTRGYHEHSARRWIPGYGRAGRQPGRILMHRCVEVNVLNCRIPRVWDADSRGSVCIWNLRAATVTSARLA